MLKSVLIAAGGFLVLIALMADNLSSDIKVKGNAAAAVEAAKPADEKLFAAPPSGAVSNAAGPSAEDIEGTGADPDINTDPFAAEGFAIDPFSAAPIDDFGESADTDPEPTIGENSVDNNLNQGPRGKAGDGGTGGPEPVTLKKANRSEIKI
ncbi:MAG: hypothetical protein AAFX04_04575 [Pseudomonadota bacterium]